MASTEQLRSAGELQARLCRENGSPTYEEIILALVAALRDDGATVRLLRDDPRDPVGSALYLRLLCAIHRLALRNERWPIRRCFPSTGGAVDPPRAVEAFFAMIDAAADEIAVEMQRDVQTNEVGRSAPLAAAMSYVAGRTGPRLRILEVGASAGLNLWLDRYRVEAGDAAWGPPDSPLRLVDSFTSGSPAAHSFTVTARRGCDLSPVDMAAEADRRLLRSFVWPEDLGRMRHLDAALAAAAPVAIDRRDACSWAAHQLARLPAGATTVVFHSVVMPYLVPAQRAEFAAVVGATGARAGAANPLAWVSMEPTPGYAGVEVRCELWPTGERLRLARCAPHGGDIDWDPVVLET